MKTRFNLNSPLMRSLAENASLDSLNDKPCSVRLSYRDLGILENALLVSRGICELMINKADAASPKEKADHEIWLDLFKGCSNRLERAIDESDDVRKLMEDLVHNNVNALSADDRETIVNEFIAMWVRDAAIPK